MSEPVSLLAGLDEALGPPGRAESGWLEALGERPPRPAWLVPPDRLLENASSRKATLLDGVLMLGRIVQENEVLRHGDGQDAAAEVLCTPDRSLWRNALWLARFAARIDADMRGADGWSAQHPWRQAVRRTSLMRTERVPLTRLPSQFTDGRVVFQSAMLVYRALLPPGPVRGHLVPLLCRPGAPPLLLPYTCWPQALLERW